MNQIGLRFSLQHDEHVYLWFVSSWWTTCFCIECIEVNGNVQVGIAGDGGDGISITNWLFLVKLKKKVFHNMHKLISSLKVSMNSTLKKMKELAKCANLEYIKAYL
jgi:hypothetical protein